ncbi:MAG: hypothetical protein ACFFFG_18355 [Candidatus Thorarchaeota archaeon]
MINRRYVFMALFIGIALLMVFPIQTQALKKVSIVNDGGLESWYSSSDLVYWSESSSTSRCTDAFEGDYSANITTAGQIFQTYSGQPSEYWVLKVKSKSLSPDSTMKLRLHIYTEGGGGGGSEIFTLTTSWQSYTFGYTGKIIRVNIWINDSIYGYGSGAVDAVDVYYFEGVEP